MLPWRCCVRALQSYLRLYDGAHLMTDRRPDPLLEQLRRLGPQGDRSAEMLMAAAEQIEQAGTRAGNLIAFCTREALVSLLDLGGKRQSNMTDAARKVVRTARRLRDGRTTSDTLLEAAQSLEAALEGPGPHSERLEQVITELAACTRARESGPAGHLYRCAW